MDNPFIKYAVSSSLTNTLKTIAFLLVFTTYSWIGSYAQHIELKQSSTAPKVEINVDGQLFTAYYYGEDIKKPVLYPVISAEGTKVTRGYPIDPQPGERVDHPHHVGFWLNYGDVNGLDFWNNSDAIPAEKRDKYGTIRHKEILEMKDGAKEGLLKVRAEWLAPDGKVLLDETTTFTFKTKDDERIIDRFTTLTAREKVRFKDNKEGMVAIRVTRFMEHPENEPITMVDSKGNITDVPVLNNEGVNGMYINSEGVTGKACWGQRARWVNLVAKKNAETISLVLIDHPSNVGYPTYWHARGYGLFAANPLGQKIFSNGEQELNFSLDQGNSVTFKYRLVLHSAGEQMSEKAIEKRFKEFSKL